LECRWYPKGCNGDVAWDMMCRQMSPSFPASCVWVRGRSVSLLSLFWFLVLSFLCSLLAVCLCLLCGAGRCLGGLGSSLSVWARRCRFGSCRYFGSGPSPLPLSVFITARALQRPKTCAMLQPLSNANLRLPRRRNKHCRSACCSCGLVQRQTAVCVSSSLLHIGSRTFLPLSCARLGYP
jgi:hypothetical protein